MVKFGTLTGIGILGLVAYLFTRNKGRDSIPQNNVIPQMVSPQINTEELGEIIQAEFKKIIPQESTQETVEVMDSRELTDIEKMRRYANEQIENITNQIVSLKDRLIDVPERDYTVINPQYSVLSNKQAVYQAEKQNTSIYRDINPLEEEIQRFKDFLSFNRPEEL